MLPPLRTACAALLAACAVTTARADVLAEAGVATQYEHNTNIFALQTGLPPIPGSRGHYDEDTQFHTGSLQVQYRQGDQRLSGDVSGVLARYGNYTGLDHSTSHASVTFDWRLRRSLYGNVGVKQSRAMISFAELNTPELLIQSEHDEFAGVRIEPNPRWRIEGDAQRRTLSQPLPTVPSLRLREDSGQAGLLVSPTTYLTLGPRLGALRGEFSSSSVAVPRYDQRTLELYANYRSANGALQLTARGGHTRRDSSFAREKVSGVTGEINLQHSLTERTGYQIWTTRTVDNYITNLGADLETRTAVNLNLRPTYKIRVTLGYVWANMVLPAQGFVPLNSDRHDHIQTGTLKIDYAARRWLVIRPYAIVQTRSSNLNGADFDATTLGITVAVTWRNYSDER